MLFAHGLAQLLCGCIRSSLSTINRERKSPRNHTAPLKRLAVTIFRSWARRQFSPTFSSC